MEQNYVTVTLCYSFRQRTGGRLGEHPLEWLWRNPLPGGVQSKVSGLRKHFRSLLRDSQGLEAVFQPVNRSIYSSRTNAVKQ